MADALIPAKGTDHASRSLPTTNAASELAFVLPDLEKQINEKSYHRIISAGKL